MIHGSGVRIGLHSGQQYHTVDEMRILWGRAEELGFDFVSLFDHFRPPLGGPGGPCFEGTTLLSALAASTRRVRCGMLVSPVTWRHPAIAASIAATLDHVSSGRLEFGVGAGGPDLGYEQYGIHFPPPRQRLEMLDEACHLMRRLWTEEVTDFTGRHFHLSGARLAPKPLQPHLPLIIGGGGERHTLRIVARHADIWNVLPGDPDTYRRKRDRLAGYCSEAGRAVADIRGSITFRVVLAADERSASQRWAERMPHIPPADRSEYLLFGTPEQCVAALLPYLRLGARDLLLGCRPPLDWPTIELFASQVAPALRAAV